MPGCIGALDCTHWQWLKCLKALAGQYHDRKGKRSVVIESVCNEDTYNWQFFIGAPGRYNDTNVLASSPLMLDVNAGVWPPRNIFYTLNGQTRGLLFYTADRGYLRYALFATPHSIPDTRKLAVHNRLQEAVRRDAESMYALMLSRFNMFLRPARFTSVFRMINTGKAAANLHNMAIECTREDFVSQQRMQEQRSAARTEAIGGQGAFGGDQAAFVVDDGPSGGGVWGPPVSIETDGQSSSNGHEAEHDIAVGSLLYTDGAKYGAKDTNAHFALLHDLSEHIYANRVRLLLPYL